MMRMMRMMRIMRMARMVRRMSMIGMMGMMRMGVPPSVAWTLMGCATDVRKRSIPDIYGILILHDFEAS